MTSTPDPIATTPVTPPRAVRVIDLIKAIAALALILAMLVWFYRLALGARSAARESQCIGQIFYIAHALQNYHDTYGTFPPAYIPDEQGRPMHSWRVLLLPFLEAPSLYQRYKFNEPWDGPNNRKLMDEMRQLFACPNHRGDNRSETHTSYVVLTGQHTLFPGATSRSLSALRDDPRQTMLLVEVADLDIPWTAPIDLDVDAGGLDPSSGIHPSLSSADPHGPAVVRADFRYRRLGRPLPPLSTLKAIATIDGGELVDWPGDR